MNSSPNEQLRLLELQEIDLGIARLDHQAQNLPILKELAHATSGFESHRDLAIASATERSDIDVELNRSASDVAQVDARIKKDQEFIDSGKASAKDLQNLLGELESLKRRKEELEEVELEIMVRIDDAASRQSHHEAERDRFESEVVKLAHERDNALSALEAKRSELTSSRVSTASQITKELLDLYEKIRASNGGVGAAKLKDGKCEGCHLQVNTVELTRIKSLPEDEIVRCEECRRILVRN